MKILQIIPATSGMYAKYELEDGRTFNSPVLVFALIEREGKQYVQPLDFDRWTGLVSPYTYPEAFEEFRGYFFEY